MPTDSRAELLATLEAHTVPVAADDTMAEAGRKVLLGQLIEMLQHEDGSRAGDDIEAVHDMRVAIRRMRSTLRLLEAYYKPKAIKGYADQLRKLARALGGVRDRDVLIEDLKKYAATLTDEAQRAQFSAAIVALDADRQDARADLIKVLNKGEYRRFVTDFAQFLLTTGAGVRAVSDEDVHPIQVRHALPTLIYARLGHVRAYDSVLDGADDTTLHSLRIEFKRLRYAATVFAEVLGDSIKPFISELKAAQDHLGRLQDIATAEMYLHGLAERLDDGQKDAVQTYLDALSVERETLYGATKDIWRRFNLRSVQKQLATAVAAL